MASVLSTTYSAPRGYSSPAVTVQGHRRVSVAEARAVLLPWQLLDGAAPFLGLHIFRGPMWNASLVRSCPLRPRKAASRECTTSSTVDGLTELQSTVSAWNPLPYVPPPLPLGWGSNRCMDSVSR